MVPLSDVLAPCGALGIRNLNAIRFIGAKALP
jgi:hypothetical protein